MPPISQTGTVEPPTVATHNEPVVDPTRAATSILTGIPVEWRAVKWS
jgi:hypothetical protein